MITPEEVEGIREVAAVPALEQLGPQFFVAGMYRAAGQGINCDPVYAILALRGLYWSLGAALKQARS